MTNVPPDPQKRSFAYRLVYSFVEMARELQALRRELLARPAPAQPPPAPPDTILVLPETSGTRIVSGAEHLLLKGVWGVRPQRHTVTRRSPEEK